MKNVLTVSVLVCFNMILLVGVILFTTPSFSNYMSGWADDEEIYKKINSIVADTPGARLGLESAPDSGTTVMTVTTDSPQYIQEMIRDGILDYIPLLDGEVTAVIEYQDMPARAVMTIIQEER